MRLFKLSSFPGVYYHAHNYFLYFYNSKLLPAADTAERNNIVCNALILNQLAVNHKYRMRSRDSL